MNSHLYRLLAVAVIALLVSFTGGGRLMFLAIGVALLASVLLIVVAGVSAYRGGGFGPVAFASIGIVILGLLLYGLGVLSTIH